jgi:hypothetical protein
LIGGTPIGPIFSKPLCDTFGPIESVPIN